ncbi:DUF1806 family protein [Paenibacillus silvisoli]|uniref:DUF1806 family protein n=1 Tax=Paenibacillus silvisoli TaxID=3110539 RepID=UPI00280553CA|nr:DUF1806 family protein [Paenibacillus silvisoli]
MKPILITAVEEELLAYIGQEAYIHCEATSDLFVRNFKVSVTEAHLAGDGAYRVALRFKSIGWLRMEGLTHYEVDRQGRLLMAGFDGRGRMHVALELGKEPFPE